MLRRTREWHGPLSSQPLHEDTPSRRTCRHRLKAHQWKEQNSSSAGYSTAVIYDNNFMSNNYESENYLKWRCSTTIADSILVDNHNNNSNNNKNSRRLPEASESRDINDTSTQIRVQDFEKAISNVHRHGTPYFGTRGARHKSTSVSSTQGRVTKNLSALSGEVPFTLNMFQEQTDWAFAESLNVVKRTLSSIAGGSLRQHWSCLQSLKEPQTSHISEIEYGDERIREKRVTSSASLTTVQSPLECEASSRSVGSSSRDRQHRSRQRKVAHHLTPFTVFVSSVLLLLVLLARPVHSAHQVHCGQLLIGQYRCPEPEIDVITQQVSGCSSNNSAPIVCAVASELFCLEGTGINSTHFMSEVPCEWTNGYSFELSLLLSVFLGWLGLDRLYLGYPGLALAKFCTLGGIFLWQLIDIVLIAMQVVRPADGSQYVVSYFGPRLTRLSLNNETQILAQDDW